MELSIDKVVDAKGQSCPMPVVMARKASKEMQAGQVMAVEATDPGSQTDIPSWANALGHELLEKTHDGDVFRYVIRIG
jgi:tRNA 2-thiouridine synthesizing protein A